MPLGPFALTIDGDLMCATEVADAQLGPALSFGRAYAEPVENRGDAVVRQYASLFTDQLHGLDIGLPAILASTVFRHFKPRMVTPPDPPNCRRSAASLAPASARSR